MTIDINNLRLPPHSPADEALLVAAMTDGRVPTDPCGLTVDHFYLMPNREAWRLRKGSERTDHRLNAAACRVNECSRMRRLAQALTSIVELIYEVADDRAQFARVSEALDKVCETLRT